MWFILNTKKQCATSEWKDYIPEWSDELSKAVLYPSKEAALEHIQTVIRDDQTADPPRYPCYVGCRVVNLITYIAELLSRRGLDVTPDHDLDCIYLNVESKDLKESLRTLPRGMGIVPFKLRTRHNKRVHPWPELTIDPSK